MVFLHTESTENGMTELFLNPICRLCLVPGVRVKKLPEYDKLFASHFVCPIPVAILGVDWQYQFPSDC